MWEIPVFAAERDAGVADRVRAASSVAYACPAASADPAPGIRVPARALAAVRGRVKASDGQPDLHYLRTVLATTGVNRNDDVFGRVETYAARHTPKDKPFNYEHVGDDIIGHITGSHAADVQFNPLAEGLAAEDLPEKFHLLTAAVLYKFWEDEALQERMDTILAEIAKGQWFVSMEALFKGFDYLLLREGQRPKVVARGEGTAFLTKHLKAYGGEGKYEQYRVCRYLRNITFAGKGLVRKPANPESVILPDEVTDTAKAEFFTSAAELGYGSRGETPPNAHEESQPMAADAELLTENKALKAEVETLKASLKEHDSKQAKAQVEAVTADLNAAKSQLAAADEKLKAAAADATAWQAKAEAALLQAKEAGAALEKARAEQKRAARVAVLVTSLEMDEAKASETAAKLAYLTDEDFKAHAEYMATKLADYKKAGEVVQKGTADGSNTGTSTTPAKQPPQQTDKPAPMGGGSKKVKTLAAEADAAAANADTQALGQAQADAAAALATASTDDGVEKVRASISEYMTNFFGLEAEEKGEK